jgi:hypothetical protein
MRIVVCILSLQPLALAGSSLADFSTPKMEAICSFEASVYTRSTRRHIAEDGILQIILKLTVSGQQLYVINLQSCASYHKKELGSRIEF